MNKAGAVITFYRPKLIEMSELKKKQEEFEDDKKIKSSNSVIMDMQDQSPDDMSVIYKNS